MPDGALLIDRAYFDTVEWREQSRDGFSVAAAWLDLLAITNQKPATIHVRGVAVDLARGQSGFSKKTLAERWGWSQGKVSARYTAWEKHGRIKYESSNETTITTILNYDNYQTGLRTLCEQIESKPGAYRAQTETEKGEGRRDREGNQGEKGEGKGTVPDRQVTYDMALNWVRSNDDTFYTDEQIHAEWLYFDGRRGPNGEWLTERGQIWTDWRSALTLGLKRSFGQKKSAVGNGLSANVTAIQTQHRQRDLSARVAELENEVYQDRVSNLPRDFEKITRLKALRAELAQTQTATAA